MNPVPNIISSSRGVAALAMLLFPVFSPGFWAMYIWGCISDMIYGMLAIWPRLKYNQFIGALQLHLVSIDSSR